MMLRWVSICLLAFAIVRWSGNVQAEDELDEKEKRLLNLEAIEEDFKREMVCVDACAGDANYNQCMADCNEVNELREKMAARMEQNTSGKQKKILFWRRRRRIFRGK